VISDVAAENDPGYGTKDEAIRVIKRGPNWKPAVQNGRNVIYRHKQGITFVVQDE
jgi:protein TonB